MAVTRDRETPLGSPRISIIIPHHNHYGLLAECLESLAKCGETNIEVIVVDNASTDGSAARLQRAFPNIQVIGTPKNLGYAGGCNLGVEFASSGLLLFLNNDTVHEPGWLSLLAKVLDDNPHVGAVQPKVLDYLQRDRFDHAGAAGGELDLFAMPFARGRVFEHRERDLGQYDSPVAVFWASGTALLVRRTAFEAVGGFDPLFFAHMEEIDLCWRLHLANLEVWVQPRAVVYHHGAATLPRGSFRKHYLNHRNSLVMLCSNHTASLLTVLLPTRIALELAALLRSFFVPDIRQATAILASLCWLVLHPHEIARKRRLVRSLRGLAGHDVVAGLYRGSVAYSYFLRGLRTHAELQSGLKRAG